MSAIQSNQIFIVSGTVAAANNNNNAQNQVSQNQAQRRRFKNGRQSICDLIVILVALPSLTVLGLMLESFTRDNWLETTQSRLTVLALGAGLAIICLALCIYVTSRLGRKFLWVGPQYSTELGAHYSYYNPRALNAENNDLPPKYDVVMGFDIPPPAYDTIIDVEKLQYENNNTTDAEKSMKEIAIQHI